MEEVEVSGIGESSEAEAKSPRNKLSKNITRKLKKILRGKSPQQEQLDMVPVELAERMRLDREQTSRNNSVITKVLDQGLLSARDQLEGGQKPHRSHKVNNLEHELVYGHWLWDEGEIDFALIGGEGFGGAFSVLPVIAERSTSGVDVLSSEPVEVLEDRIANSMLVVVPKDSLPQRQQTDAGVSYLKATSHLPSPIKPTTFAAVLMPEAIYERAPDAIKNGSVPVIPVGNRIEDVGMNGAAKLCTVPDYKSGLEQLMTERSERPLFVHGVRLYAKDDIKP